MNKNLYKIIKIFLISLIVVISTMEALFLFVFPNLLNKFFSEKSFIELVKNKTNLELSYENLFVKTLPDFSVDVSAKKISLTDLANKKIVVSDNLFLNLKLLPLLRKNICLSTLNLEDIYIYLVRKPDNKIYIGDYSFGFDAEINWDFSNLLNKIHSQNITIVFDDKLVDQLNNLDIKQFDVFYKKNKSLSIFADAKILLNNIPKTFINIDIDTKLPLKKAFQNNDDKFNIKIKDFDISIFSNYLEYKLAQKINVLDGKVNIEAFHNADGLQLNGFVQGFDMQVENPLDSLFSSDDIKFTTNLSFENKKILLNNFDISSTLWHINLLGEIDNIFTTKPKLDVVLNIKNSCLNSLSKLLPTTKLDLTNATQKLKKYGVWGNINANLQIKGDFYTPDIYGNLVVDNAYIVKQNLSLEPSHIRAEFNKDKMSINARVYTGANQYIDVDGITQTKAFGDGEFAITSTPDIDAKTAVYMLIPIHEMVGFDIGPVPYMDINGKGNIDLKTKGTVLDGFAYGQLNFKNTTASLQGLNTEITNIDGTLDFDGKNMHFYTKKALHKKHSIKINGKANFDGNIDFNVVSESQNINDLFVILNTSPILDKYKTMASLIENVEGDISLVLKIKGVVKDYAEILKDNILDVSGDLNLKKVNASLKDMPLFANAINGKLHFDNFGWTTNLNGLIGSSKFSLIGSLKDAKTSLKINAPNLKTDEILPILSNQQTMPATNSYIDFKGQYNSDTVNFDIKSLVATGVFKPYSNLSQSSDIVIQSGTFSLDKGNVSLKNFKAKFFNSKIIVNGFVDGVYTQHPKFNGKLNLHSFDISSLDSIKNVSILPTSLKRLLNTYENYKGIANVDITSSNNNLNGKIHLSNVRFSHKVLKTPVALDSGDIVLDGNKVIMKSFVAQVDNTPVFLNFILKDIDKKIKINGYLTSKLTERFANKYINSLLTYPLKLKGDIVLTVNLQGDIDNLRVKPNLKLEPKADIYYMGANLGDDSETREISADLIITNGVNYLLKDFCYKRFMISQNEKLYPLPIITANGNFKRSGNSFYIKNLNILTHNQASVRLFNIIFKKSVLKRGLFNCKLNIKGQLSEPVINGDLDMVNLEMPLYDSIIKNLALKFAGNSLTVNVSGEALGSDFSLQALMQNSLIAPFVVHNLKLKSQKIDVNKFVDTLTEIPTPNTVARMVSTHNKIGSSSSVFSIADFLINSGTVVADEVVINESLTANNLTSDFSLGKDLLLSLKNLSFDITTGKMLGTAKYDFSSNKLITNISGYNVDSNKIASSLFGFKDQIFGSANGSISVTTKGKSEEERIKNMLGNVYFEIADGKMPKLGSVEYLLKAGDFFKSGITGANINNLLGLIAPIKTGYFEAIKGSFTLKNGVAQNIEIYSKGDNLNMFLNGEFDILQNYANLRVFGRLTKRANNILGPIGNLSLNSLLNSIPAFKFNADNDNDLNGELAKIPQEDTNDDKQYRIFTVKIDGKIDDEKFVKNFRWLD